jgi:hypothetical protein
MAGGEADRSIAGQPPFFLCHPKKKEADYVLDFSGNAWPDYIPALRHPAEVSKKASAVQSAPAGRGKSRLPLGAWARSASSRIRPQRENSTVAPEPVMLRRYWHSYELAPFGAELIGRSMASGQSARSCGHAPRRPATNIIWRRHDNFSATWRNGTICSTRFRSRTVHPFIPNPADHFASSLRGAERLRAEAKQSDPEAPRPPQDPPEPPHPPCVGWVFAMLGRSQKCRHHVSRRGRSASASRPWSISVK